MKAIILLFSVLTFGSANVWASNLLPYVEMPVESQNLLAFSSQGLKFKECTTCVAISLKPNKNVMFYEHNSPIDIKLATDLYVSKKHDLTSIFYDRLTLEYDQVVFGGFLEEDEEPILPNSNAQ